MINHKINQQDFLVIQNHADQVAGCDGYAGLYIISFFFYLLGWEPFPSHAIFTQCHNWNHLTICITPLVATVMVVKEIHHILKKILLLCHEM